MVNNDSGWRIIGVNQGVSSHHMFLEPHTAWPGYQTTCDVRCVQGSTVNHKQNHNGNKRKGIQNGK